MENDGEFSGNGYNRASVTTRLGEPHAPSLQTGPSCSTGQHHIGRSVEHVAHLRVTTFGTVAVEVHLARLYTSWRQAKVHRNRSGLPEARGIIDRGLVAQRRDEAHPWCCHKPLADRVFLSQMTGSVL